MQRWLLITIQSVDVGSCLAESAHHCGRALEEDSKVQGGHLGGNSGEQQQIKNYWPSSIWIWILLKTNSFLGLDRFDFWKWSREMDGFCQYSCSQLLMIFQKSNIASSLFSVPIREKNSNLKPALQSDSASHLCNTIWILASGWEKIPVELSTPAYHLLPLIGDQQLVEERAVGPGEAIMLERWLRCREE